MLITILISFYVTFTAAFYFEPGFDYFYTYSSESNLLDIHNITTIMKVRIRQITRTEDGTALHQLILDSFIQHSRSAYMKENPMKWNLSKPFLFSMKPDGLVTLVKYSLEDEYEVVTLKKVLASVLSANRKDKEEKIRYTNVETDHSGHLEHIYEAERTTYGSKVTRKHHSNNGAERSHNKTLHYNAQGTVTFVSTADRVTLRAKQEEKNRNHLLGEVRINDIPTGDFPSPRTISVSQMKLQGKRKIKSTLSVDGLVEDSLLVVPKPVEKKRLQEENDTIAKLMDCVESQSDKFSTNRTECVVQLREIFSRLDDQDFRRLAKQHLEIICHPNDTLCKDRRNLIIDMTSRRTDNVSQELIIRYILRNKIVVEEEIQRFLFHCPGIKHPTYDLVLAVKSLCLGEDDKLYGATELLKTQRRACLALGSLAKNIKSTNASMAEDISSKIENWLNFHNETHSSKILKPRKKRHVTEFDADRHHHIVTKMVLLQVLGNAGMEKSAGHIISYMQPGQGAIAWRRSAIRGLRHFGCNKSAEALLTIAIRDESDIVRKMAIEAFKNHPKGNLNTREYKNILLGRNYSYPVLMRMKRGIDFSLDENGLYFNLEVPGINWRKVIGSSTIGAVIGLEMRNKLELELAPLSGYFEVDVYDTAYAEVHVGYVGLHQDIFRALACYRGYIGYDFNILKDFGINKLSDLVHAFDRIFSSIIDPIISVIQNFKKIVKFFQNGGIAKLIDTIANIVRNLPIILETVATKIFSMVKKMLDVGGQPWLQKGKILVVRIKNIIEDIKDNIMEFYNTIADAVTVTMPYIGKKLIDSIVLLFSSLKGVLQNPAQSFKGFGKAILQIRMAILMFIDTKNHLIDTLSFKTGKMPPWMNIGDDIIDLFDDLKDFVVEIKSSVTGTESLTKISDGIAEKLDCKKVHEELAIIIKESIDPLFSITEIAKPFLDVFKSVIDAIKLVKNAYEQVKIVINKAKSLVQKVFGPKFDLKFPNRRRKEKAPCGKGIWPTTSGDTFDTTGVDLLIASGRDVVCPVNGMVQDKSNNKLLIKPSDDDFKEFHIVLQNVIPNKNVTHEGNFFNAGEKIGKASKSKCSPNFIHLALRKTASSDLDDKEYEYIDPSPYLDSLVPVPKWIEECNDFSFEHLFQIIESDALDKEGGKEKEEDIRRSNKDKQKELSELDISKESSIYRPPGMDTDSSKAIGQQFGESLKNAFSAFGDIGKLFKGSVKIPNLLEIFDINGMSLKRVKQILQTSGQIALVGRFDEVVLRLEEIILDAPTVNLQSLSVPKLRYLLSLHGITVPGTKSSMVSKILSMATKLCPVFLESLAKGFGHICTPHSDCLGLTCGINLPFGITEKKFKVDIRIDSCKGQLHIKTFETNTISLDGFEHNINIGMEAVCGCSPSAKLIVKGEMSSDKIRVSVGATVCIDEFVSCLPVIDILNEATFTIAADCTQDTGTIGSLQSLYDMQFGTFISLLSEFSLLDSSILEIFNNIRDAVLNSVFDDPQEILQIVGQEFKAKLDVCVDVHIPFPPIDINFLNDPAPIYFMIGPIPMSFSYGAGGAIGLQMDLGFCFISMKAKIKLDPWVGGKVWGALAIDIGFARAGLKLVGYILQTQFPTTATLKFDKFPLEIGAKMDLVLVPLGLKLKAFAELYLWLPIIGKISITVFDATIWEYKSPAIKTNIFEIPSKDDDKSPPEFMPSSVNKRKKRDGSRGCLVKQIIGRSVIDPAFILEVSSEDEVSDVLLDYAIGTQEGGTNVIDWTEIGGNSLVVPSNLPNGIPLYWTVRAKNSQGLFAYTHCMLHTYDNTVPDGRVDPSYIYSSHPHTLSGTVFVFDDSPIVEYNAKAVGYNSGQNSEVMNWDTFTTTATTHRSEINNVLKYFSVPKPGKLTSVPFSTFKVLTDIVCATECLKYRAKCVAFDFEYHSETCDLHEFVEGPNSIRRISGTYKTYERLGIGHTSYIEYQNVQAEHGKKYYINVKITNALNYTSYLHSEGTIVDFTPPFTGPLGEGYTEEIRADKCQASILQRCVNTTERENHRFIVDGKNARTVFNGLHPLFDQMYTPVNHYASVNFDGFNDNETGIWAYTWAFGTKKCGTDIVSFRDPHAHLTSKRYWSHTGFTKHLRLDDGPYFATVQSLNNVVFGGALVCTVCHSTPIIVDRSPPTHVKVTGIIYDEDFDILAIYYNASDPHSGLSSIDFGLGITKHDVKVRGYSLHRPMKRADPYVVIEDLGLPPGVPAWIRLRAVNNVDFFTTGHYDEPIIIDRTPPVQGHVLDGNIHGKDLTYQSDNRKICSQWKNFYDPESGIHQFQWSVGTLNKTDDIVPFQNLTHHERSACANVDLEHNVTYYSTVITYNDALNMKEVNNTSNGDSDVSGRTCLEYTQASFCYNPGQTTLWLVHVAVLVDITPPVSGWIYDGVDHKIDLEYSSHSASKSCNWNNFTDPESKIAKYEIDLYINNKFTKQFQIDNGESTSFTDHSVRMNHLDYVYFSLKAFDGADLTVTQNSNGFLVDHTTPLLRFIQDSDTGSQFQTLDTKLNFWWEFEDPESNIKEYRYFVSKQHHGTRTRVWPVVSNYVSVKPVASLELRVAVVVDDFKLANGAMYAVHVTAVNNALLTTSHQSNGVTVDTTAPLLFKVRIGLPEEDEEQDELGNILHFDINGITASWRGFDPESGITNFYACIGSHPRNCTVTKEFVDFGTKETAYIKGDKLETFASSNTLYYVAVKARNGAGLFSETLTSSPIKVLKANIPGIVYDGPVKDTDDAFTADHSSLSMSFQGFASESCNIISYEWCIGSSPYFSDIMPYTDYGVNKISDGNGQGSVHVHLDEYNDYFVTVRAKTGHNCHEEYIVSSSNGIQLDITPPNVRYIGKNINESNSVIVNSIQFQKYTDTLEMEWILAETAINVSWAIGSYPAQDNIFPFSKTEENKIPAGPYSLIPGYSYFVTLRLQDSIGHAKQISSLPIISDITAPYVKNFSCIKVISKITSIIFCSWDFIEELESMIKQIRLMIGTSDSPAPQNFTILPHFVSSWQDDVKDILKRREINELEITLNIENVLGQQQTFTAMTLVDKTPPECDSVEIITRTDDKDYKIKQVCQLPQTYIEIGIQNMGDEESGIKSLEVALGSTPHTIDILSFKNVGVNETIFIGKLSLKVGSLVYAVIKIYNNVGLYSVYRSEAVVISPLPRLIVFDGEGSEDVDFQSKLNVLMGRWSYTEPCPIIKSEWKIEDITGKVLQNFTQIPGNSEHFYNDELELLNGVEYINIIRILDALNRTEITKSDGVTVLIQRPSPGNIRDGLNSDDVNYQLSSNTLSANWDSFGDAESADPTQKIVRYEVAVGSDRRYKRTQSNVHYFVNTGLRTSHTFFNLNLVSKIAKYYITVRAYSETGTYVEVTSNGVRVGFKDGIGNGVIEVKMFQSSTSQIDISWSGFESDIGINHYTLGISSKEQQISNDTFDCGWLNNGINETDIYPLRTIKFDTYVAVNNLTLHHGHLYYVIVIASDMANLCSLQVSAPILIDTTAPDTENATIKLNGVGEQNSVYLTSNDILHIEWSNITDLESHISHSVVTLYHIYSCRNTTNIDISNNYQPLRTIRVVNDEMVTFYDLSLLQRQYYFVMVTVVNKAELKSSTKSAVFTVDTSPPFAGSVKVGPSWYQKSMFQFSSTEILAWTAIARQADSYSCSNQRLVLPTRIGKNNFDWQQINGENFDRINIDSPEIVLKIGYNVPLSKVLRSGIISSQFKLLEGNYTFHLDAASGKKIITTIAFTTNPANLITEFELPDTNVLDKTSFLNMSESVFSNRSKSTSYKNQTTSSNHSSEFSSNNERKCCGYGLSILGDKENESGKWAYLFWAVDKYKETKLWVYTTTNPILYTGNYIFSLSKDITSSDIRWHVNLFINGKIKSEITGLQFDPNMYLSIRTWNKDYYEEPIQDPFSPFRSKATIKNVFIPMDYDKPCLYGKGFFEAENRIKEIWVGVSDNIEDRDNVYPMTLYREFCIPCEMQCLIDCNKSCLYNDTAFDIFRIHLSELVLKPSLFSEKNDTLVTEFTNATTYYVNVKVLDLAHHEVYARSNGIIVDVTPPECEYVRCVDPRNSMEQPTNFIGSNDTVGAYWSCTEDISNIKNYQYSVGSEPGIDDVVSWGDLRLQNKQKTVLQNSIYFYHSNTYYVNLKVFNTAGKTSNYSCNVTADFLPPNVTQTVTEALYVWENDGQKFNSILNVQFSQYFDRIGVAWESKFDDAQFYEWKIGTSPEGHDVFPRVKVGMYKSGKTKIIRGHLLLDDSNVNISISGYKSRNKSEGNITDKINADTLFLIERGRCLYESLYAVSRSHLSSSIRLNPVCYTKPEDTILSFKEKSEFHLTKRDEANVFNISQNGGPKNSTLQLNITAHSGAVSIGILSDDDLQNTYGSAASSSYKPYITNPDYSKDQTSRIMKRRLLAYLGISFFITPLPTSSVETVETNVFIKKDQLDDWSVPALARWDFDKEKWIHVEEGCISKFSRIRNDGYYTAKICLKELNNGDKRRKKRGTDEIVTMSNPMQFSVFKMNTTTANTAPVIISDRFTVNEGSFIVKSIDWMDNEDDKVTFQIERTNVGMAEISSNGILRYEPPVEYSGLVLVTVVATEVDLPYQVTPQFTRKVITIDVRDVNDPPVLAFMLPNMTIIKADIASTVDILSDGNLTDHIIGTVVILDVDKAETLSILHKSFSDGGQISVDEVTLTSIPTNDLLYENKNSVKKFNTSVKTSTQFHGRLQFSFLGYDERSDGTKLYTHRMNINLYILTSPCVHGNCTEKLSYSSCTDVIRSETFDPYYCTCHKGYIGTWCETEINECLQHSCSAIHDCIDEVGHYSCKINIGKLLGIITGLLVAICACVAGIIKYRQKKRQEYKIGDSSLILGEYINQGFQKDDDDDDDDDNDEDKGEEFEMRIKSPVLDDSRPNTSELRVRSAEERPSFSDNLGFGEDFDERFLKPGILRRPVDTRLQLMIQSRKSSKEKEFNLPDVEVNEYTV